jgi:hypothetical protein
VEGRAVPSIVPPLEPLEINGGQLLGGNHPLDEPVGGSAWSGARLFF